VLSFFLSTVAFFVAGWYIRGYLENIGIPKTMLRGFVVFVLALAVAYAVAALVDVITG
jgi:hypothetical protein